MDLARNFLELDSRLSSRLRVAERPGPLRAFAAVLAHSGDSWFWLLGLAAAYLLAAAAWKPRLAVLILGVIATAVLVLLIKFSVRRQRPEGEWGGIYRSADPHSFPSGHAARAVMLAVLAAGLGPPWFAGLLLAWAPLVGLARVAMGVHYLSDVLAGMLLGLLVGFIVLGLASKSLPII
jgi:undecaprenyl-diphosphatase